jgi:hypothetical protein
MSRVFDVVAVTSTGLRLTRRGVPAADVVALLAGLLESDDFTVLDYKVRQVVP